MKVNELKEGMLIRPARGWTLSVIQNGLKVHAWQNSVSTLTLVYLGARREKRKGSSNPVLIREVLYSGVVWPMTGASFKYFERV